MRNFGKLLIYLGDLDHFTAGNRISVPLNIASIASYCKNIYGDEIEIKLFKNPEYLMREVLCAPPHILGLSFYMWNFNLGLKVIQCCKSISPNTVTVVGGPSVARISDKYKKLLDKNPGLDIVALDQGEKSFASILDRVFSKGTSRDSLFFEAIPGCAARSEEAGFYQRGEIINSIAGIESIPSPYLNGYLDSFLKVGFLPLLETTRGCPYRCIFCERGDSLYSKLVVRDMSVIREELKYLSKHSKASEICITDSNFGLMGERDLKIALCIVNAQKKYKFPSIVTDYASARIMTEQSMEVMKIMARLSGYFYFGLQTLTKKVLNNSNRKNMPISKIRELTCAARKKNIPVVVDLIFGLPGETSKSFLKTVSNVLSLGIDQPSVYNLRILPGSAIAEKDEYNYETRFRPFNNRYGQYKLMPNNEPFRIIEVEEIAYQSGTFSRRDFVFIRKYGFLIELLARYGAFKEIIAYFDSRGVSATEIIDNILKNCKNFPKLNKLFEQYEEYIAKELFASENDLIEAICGDNKQWKDLLSQSGIFFKINIGFAGYCLFEDVKILEDIENIMYLYMRKKFKSKELENFKQVVLHDKLCRIIHNKKPGKLKESDIKKEVYFKEKFDFYQWKLKKYNKNIDEYRFEVPIGCLYAIDRYEDLIATIRKIENFQGYAFYEKILMQAPKFSLRRRCEKAA